MLHGLGTDHQMFHQQIDAFVNQGYYLIIPEMRGHGKSSFVDQVSLSDYTKDINVILNDLKIDKVILLGVSMGGVIAQQYAIKHSDKIKQLIIVDSFAEIKTLKERFIAKSQVLFLSLCRLLPKSMAMKIFSSAYQELSKTAEHYFLNMSESINFQQMVLARKAINQIDVLDQLDSVALPSLVIVGNQAPIMVTIGEKIHQRLKQSTFAVIDNSIDPSNLVAPDEFNFIVLEFLEK